MKGILSVKLLRLCVCVCVYIYTNNFKLIFSRSKQFEEVETTVLGLNSNYDEATSNVSSGSPKTQVNGSEESRSKRTIRRPAYWLEMRGIKNSINKSSAKKGTHHSLLNAKLVFSSVLL